ncbi:ubiquitin-activating E1 family protein [Emticicia fontis]
MTNEKIKAHFTDNSLLNATNPISINLIGAGGTGSVVLTSLLQMNHALLALQHPGLQVRLWDDDIITEANLGRQRFASSEVGLHKSVALINRANRFFGTNWKAETIKFAKKGKSKISDNHKATINITCVDSVQARFEISEMLQELGYYKQHYNAPRYWMDFGNSQYTGQVILSTIGKIKQPKSEKYTAIEVLPMITDEFGELLKQSESADNTPSCSLAEALTKQDLFINSSLAQMGCSLLWNLFRNGLTLYRGFFHNLKDFTTHPIKV